MADRRVPWVPGSASGVGPLPGISPVDACRLVLAELPELPHLPELPERGAGADTIGRTAGMLVDLHVDLQRSGWRLVPRPGREERRVGELLARDLDALHEVARDYRGPLKLQVAGPWTLAAGLELAGGEKALTDPGAVRDLVASLGEGIVLHTAEVRARVPGITHVILQLDEPHLPAVLAGALPTSSGWGRYPAVEEPVAEQVLRSVLEAAGNADAGVRCAGSQQPQSPRERPPLSPPLALVRRAGARFVGLNAGDVDAIADQDLGETIEAGLGLLLGLVPEAPGAAVATDLRALAAPARRRWEALGLPLSGLADVVVTPAGGLARLTLADAGQVLRRCRELARLLEEMAAGAS